MRIRAGVAAFAAVVVLAITGAASAHVVYETGNVYQDPANGRCVKVYAELSDGGYQHGYIRTSVWTMKRGWTPYGERDCIKDWAQPPNWIRTKTILWKWTQTNGWAVCKNYGTRTNSSQDFRLSFTIYTDNKCGDGWYGSTGMGQTYLGNNVWVPAYQDAWIYSGAHWLEG